MDNVVGDRPPSKFSFGYARLHWKCYLVGTIFIISLIIAFFLILFLVILKTTPGPPPPNDGCDNSHGGAPKNYSSTNYTTHVPRTPTKIMRTSTKALPTSTKTTPVSTKTTPMSTKTMPSSTKSLPTSTKTLPDLTTEPVPSTVVTKTSPDFITTAFIETVPTTSTEVLTTVHTTLKPTVQNHTSSYASSQHNERKQTFWNGLYVCVNDNWKILLITGNILFIFLVALFLVLFLVILKPKEDNPVATTVIVENTTITMGRTTVMPTLVPKQTTTYSSTTRATTMWTTTATMDCNKVTETSNYDPICTNGFQLVNNKCLKLFTNQTTRPDADAACRKSAGGAALVSIKSEEDNWIVSTFLEKKNMQKVWIGLMCYGDDDSTCKWDYGRGGISDYSSFDKGFPNTDFGFCVYYLDSVGKWVSGDCDTDTFSYICELPPTTPDACPHNYNNNCYTRIDKGMNFTKAERACNEICSHVVSIHSELENQFVMSLFTISGYLLLGGFAPAENLMLWNDLSPREYLNFRSYDADVMRILMDYKTGKWFTDDHSVAPWIVCKRPTGFSITSTTRTTTLGTSTATTITSKPTATSSVNPTTISTVNSVKTTMRVQPLCVPDAKAAEANSICINGFELVNNKCLKLFTSQTSRQSADAACRKSAGGAALVSIKSEEENWTVSGFLDKGNVQKVWIGLMCYGDDDSTCEWDYGRGTASDYSSFDLGFPNVDIGICVYYLVSAGKWVSGDCDTDSFSYLCELLPTTPDTCESNYNNNCYTRINKGMNFTEAEKACNEICSHVVSIHSELENQFVMSLFTISGYLLLGGFAPAENLILWNDLSPREYLNFRSYDADVMRILMDYKTGKWFTDDHSVAPWIVCKRPTGLSIPSTTMTTNIATTTTDIPTVISTVSSVKTTTKAVERNSICTNGFELVNNKCLKLVTNQTTRPDADAACRKSAGGAALVSIKSEDENWTVSTFLENKNVEKVWIGLICHGDDDSTCKWDYGRGSTSNYSGFDIGFPNTDFGFCVYYLVSASAWVGGNCQSESYAYICELPPTTPDICPSNYDNSCYTRIDIGMNFTEAANACMALRSHTLTIHSELENQFVKSLFNNTAGYMLLGGFAPSKSLVLWYDLSPRNYVNFDNYDPSRSLIFMNYQTGKWYTEHLIYFALFLIVNCSEPTKLCPPGLSWNNNQCWVYVNKPMSQPEAEAECGKRYGAPLLAIYNSLDNDFVSATVGKAASKAWIGLTCTATDSCSWSFDRGTPKSYTNFSPGNPNVDYGNCIYQDVSTKYWSSSQCTEKMTFLCGMPEIKADPCLHQYNDNCYFPINSFKNFGDAQDYCAKNCANLLSVNSALENQYTISLFNQSTVASLGAVASSKDNIIWVDFSIQSYNNIQTFGKENCVFTNLAMSDGRQTGEWFTDYCTRETVFVCKRPIGVKCNGGDF
ncbi:unnamed protein product [Caenorhabditis brenneri]